MKKIGLVIISILLIIVANAQDRYFAQTYTSNVIPKGSFDLEVWHTSRIGHEGQFFHAMDQRLEFEVGLGSNVQTAFYLNRYQTSFSNASQEIEQKVENGFSNEWKWRFSKPTAKIGKALYAELGVKGDEIELETKLILDKSFGKNLLAFNLVSEIDKEISRENGKTTFKTASTPLELDLAYMRQLSTSFGVGLEVRDNNELVKGNWLNSVLFAGPTINYRSNRFFIIANYLPQLGNLHKTSTYPLSEVFDTRERVEARVLLGFSF